jgi:hypothetical protein
MELAFCAAGALLFVGVVFAALNRSPKYRFASSARATEVAFDAGDMQLWREANRAACQ